MPPGQGASPGGGGAASLMVFLDANPVIYLIEQPANLGSKVTARVSDLLASGERLAVSDLVRMECQVGPLKANDAELLARYATFFSSPDLDVPVSSGSSELP